MLDTYNLVFGAIVLGAYIWMSIVAVRKGHGVWLWSLLVPFVSLFGVPYAASRPAKPGSAAFRRFKPGDPKAMESIRAYPTDAARVGIEGAVIDAAKAGFNQDGFPIEYGSEETVWVHGMSQKLKPETPHQVPSSAIPTKAAQLTLEEQLAAFESLHRIGAFSGEQIEQLRKRYRDLDHGES
jgi:hypothetical protein